MLLLLGLLSPNYKALTELREGKLYVENVRSYFKTSQKSAESMCDYGVNNGILEEWISFEHPEFGHSIVEYREDEIPDEETIVHCEISEGEGTKADFKLRELRKRRFYRAASE